MLNRSAVRTLQTWYRVRELFTEENEDESQTFSGGVDRRAVLLVGSTVQAADKVDIKIGMVAKSQSNAVFQAAYAGAKAAAKELGESTTPISRSTGRRPPTKMRRSRRKPWRH